MTTLSLNLPPFRPYSIGFDRIFDDLSRNLRMVEPTKYPAYNITYYEMCEEHPDRYVISIALAGFSVEDIDVTETDNTLTIKTSEAYAERTDMTDVYPPLLGDALHKGIAERKFTLSFQLADDVVVNSSTFKNGMLRVDIDRHVPEEKKPRKIDILDMNS